DLRGTGARPVARPRSVHRPPVVDIHGGALGRERGVVRSPAGAARLAPIALGLPRRPRRGRRDRARSLSSWPCAGRGAGGLFARAARRGGPVRAYAAQSVDAGPRLRPRSAPPPPHPPPPTPCAPPP